MPRYLYRVGIIALLSFGLVACSSQYFSSLSHRALQDLALANRYQVQRNAQWVLPQSSAIYLAHVVDPAREQRQRASFALHHALVTHLNPMFPHLRVAASPEGLTRALAAAENSGATLLLWPRLVAVEDRLNTRQELLEGKGLHPHNAIGRDSAMFYVYLYEVRTEALLDIAAVSARGRMFAANDAVPHQLFEGAAGALAQQLSGRLMAVPSNDY